MATGAKQWKKKNKDQEKLVDLEVPSGNTCQVRRPGPELFMRQGMIPNSLMQLILPLLEDAKKQGAKGDSTPIPEEAFGDLQKELLDDPTKFADMLVMVDNITVACVVQPVVWPESKRAEVRQEVRTNAIEGTSDEAMEALIEEAMEDYLFVDEVDFEDKMMIFSFAVGGSGELEKFRLGTQSLVAAGPAGSEVPQPTQ